MGSKHPKELPLKRTLRDCDPDGFVSTADLRVILRCSRGKIDHMVREGKLPKYHIGGNVIFKVQSALDIIENATGKRPNPWAAGD